PFLQSVLPDARLVPLIVGDLTEAQLGQAARAVQAIIDEQTVIVASSDFTHYGPNYGYRPALAGGASDGIRALDDGAFATIVNCDRRAFQRYLDRTGITICGARPITLLLEVLSVAVDGPQGALLHYATSAELTGDWSNSVSYAAIVFNKKAPPAAQESTGHSGRLQNPARPMVDVAAQQSLLTLARHVLERFVRDEQKTFRDAELPAFESGASLQHPRGAFVTLKKKGKLRGCIGYVEGVRPLYRAVVENTINAACDSRFPHRVTPDELRDIVIEISVMTPLARVADLKEIEIGRDGLVLRKGGSGSLLLPQVPLEFGWDIEAYLLNLSRKAGLAADVYRELGRGVELYRFSAQVFSEKG
ncbi:MAG: AmmeMemoRadiSam system protein A, partial [Deltaproteobacteria bacterium]|nr:AmmeMemoRadiSam system protein A [Deltaproteobacteria bacterium]